MKTINPYSKPLSHLSNNQSKEALTSEQLRSLPGCENYSTEQAERIVASIQKLAGILLEFTRQENINTIDNQHVVYLSLGDNLSSSKKIAA